MHLGSLPILTKPFVKSEQVVSPYNAIVRIAKPFILQPFTKTLVNAATSVSGVFLFSPAQLTQPIYRLHVAPGIIETSADCTFGLLVSNFSLTIHLLPKRIVVAYDVKTPTVIVDLTYKKASRTSQKTYHFACPSSSIAAAHYILTKGPEVKMTLHKGVESKDFNVLIKIVYQRSISLERISVSKKVN